MCSPDLIPPNMCCICLELIAEDDFYVDHRGDRINVHAGQCAYKTGLPRLYPFDTPEKLAFAGDWHGNLRYAEYTIKHLATLGVTHILHAGDFGWAPSDHDIHSLEQTLAIHDVHILFADGNHDDHDQLDALEDPQLTDHIRHLRRGTRWQWKGMTFLALGGAHSVDRLERVPGADWWPQETIGHADVERAISGGTVEVMITHDCPSGVGIPGIEGNPYGFPASEIRASENHRDVLRAVVDEVQPRVLFHGHYHVRYTTTLFGDDYHTQIHGLDMDGTGHGRNVAVYTMDELAAEVLGVDR